MENESFSPKSLASLKRRAGKIKKERGIAHARALDIAAMRAGFQTYAHARRSLLTSPTLLGLSIRDQAAAVGHEFVVSDDVIVAHRTKLLSELDRGRMLCRAGEPAPYFHGGNDVEIAGWLVEKAGVEADARAGRPRRVYEALSRVADEYTGDRAWAETLIMRAMHVLAGVCTPRVAATLREYSDTKYFAYGDEFGY